MESYILRLRFSNVPLSILFLKTYKRFWEAFKRLLLENCILAYHKTDEDHAEIYYRLSRKRSLCIFVTYLILNHKDTPKSWATRLDKTSYLDQNVSQTYQTKIFKTGRLWSFWLKKPEDFTLYSEIAKYQKKKK